MREYFNHYFNGSRPVCGEEKQYTLFFYNKLLSVMAKESLDESDLTILKICGIDDPDVRLIGAAFEATYMRDIFSQERYDRQGENRMEQCICPGESEPSFNEMLFSYVNRTFHVPMEYVYLNRNFGKGKVFRVKTTEERQPQQMIDILKGMMNEKPAIALFYESGAKKYLKLLDCKYLSGESMNKGLTQARLQEMIAEFLCERIRAESGENVYPQNGVVYFVSEKNKNWKCISESPEHCIRLEELIPEVLKNTEDVNEK